MIATAVLCDPRSETSRAWKQSWMLNAKKRPKNRYQTRITPNVASGPSCSNCRIKGRLALRRRVAGVSGRSAVVRVFKGIPFATPPVGLLRWRTPQPVVAWDGVRQANEFGPRCMQIDGRQPAAAAQPMSEDCLYLNVWTTADGQSTRRPVIVWSHGGSFLVGAGSLPEYDAEALARKGIVVVTHNYRLGPFGFFAHSGATKSRAGTHPATTDLWILSRRSNGCRRTSRHSAAIPIASPSWGNRQVEPWCSTR